MPTRSTEKEGVLKLSAHPSRAMGALFLTVGSAAALGCAYAAGTNGWLLLMLFAMGSIFLALGASMMRARYDLMLDPDSRSYLLLDVKGFSAERSHRGSAEDIHTVRRTSRESVEITWSDGVTPKLRFTADMQVMDALVRAASRMGIACE